MIKVTVDGLMDKYFTRLFKKIYTATSVSPFASLENIPLALKPYIDAIYKKQGLEPNVTYVETDMSFIIPKKKKAMVAFSSGKDCVAVVTKLLSKGFEVVLFHVEGVNRSYPQEKEHAKAIADYLGLEIIFKKIKVTGKCDFIENPTKNHFILAMMVDEGIPRDISYYLFGNQLADTLETVNGKIMGSDALELFEILAEFYGTMIDGYKLPCLLHHLTDSYTQVAKYDSNLFPLISSCNGALRYKNNLRKVNSEKYGVELLPDRCGSCYKCAQESWFLHHMGVKEFPKEYLDKCLEIMKKWTPKLYDGFNKNDELLEGIWMHTAYLDKFMKKHGNEIKRI